MHSIILTPADPLVPSPDLLGDAIHQIERYRADDASQYLTDEDLLVAWMFSPAWRARLGPVIEYGIEMVCGFHPAPPGRPAKRAADDNRTIAARIKAYALDPEDRTTYVSAKELSAYLRLRCESDVVTPPMRVLALYIADRLDGVVARHGRKALTRNQKFADHLAREFYEERLERLQRVRSGRPRYYSRLCKQYGLDLETPPSDLIVEMLTAKGGPYQIDAASLRARLWSKKPRPKNSTTSRLAPSNGDGSTSAESDSEPKQQGRNGPDCGPKTLPS